MSERRPIRPEAHVDHVTPYDRFGWSDVQVETFLATGAYRRELAAFFGEREYLELTALAKQAKEARPRAEAPGVLLIPGIMGSQLGRRRSPPLPHDTVWIDPVDIELGRLSMLKLPPASPIVSLGIVLYTYLRLKLHLQIAGFTPTFHDYDWRLGLDELGRALAERVKAAPPGKLAIVAHSMGGLVTRSALAAYPSMNVERVVLLGTPNAGSFAAVQALRGTYPVVRKIARLAADQSAELLAAEVFSTFPSLYQLLPGPDISGRLDFFDPASWPRSGKQPDRELLAQARSVQSALAPADDRFVTIVGAGQETVTRAERRNDEFVYTVTRDGDGTVPVASAVLPGARAYYTRVAHSELARDATVARAIADLILKGSTGSLQTRRPNFGAARARISDRALRRTHVGKVDWAHLEPDERRVFLQTLNEPPKLRLRAPARTRAKPVQRKSRRQVRSMRRTAKGTRRTP